MKFKLFNKFFTKTNTAKAEFLLPESIDPFKVADKLDDMMRNPAPVPGVYHMAVYSKPDRIKVEFDGNQTSVVQVRDWIISEKIPIQQ